MRRTRAPDLPTALVLAAAAVLALLAVRRTPDDAFWQIVYGQAILSGRLPAWEVFSWTAAGRPLIVTEWLYDAILAAASRLSGWAVWLLAFGCLAALGGTCLRLFAARTRDRSLAAVLALAALAVAAPFAAPLPQLGSDALWAALWAVLERGRLRGPRGLWLAPVITAVWANVHGTFPLACALLLVETLLARLPPRHTRLAEPHHAGTRRWLPAVTAISLGATLLTPYGWRLYGRVWGLATNGFHLAHIAEFQSPNFHTLYGAAVLGPFLLLVLAAVLLGRRRLPARAVVMGLACVAGVLWAVRLAPYGTIPLGLLAASALRARRPRPAPEGWPLVLVALAIPLAVLVRRPPPAWPVTAGWPTGAADFVAAHLAGRGFNTYADGSFLLWRWRGHPPVYIDSRGDVYMGTGVLARYVAITRLQVDPGPVLAAEGVRWALLPHGQPLAKVLRLEGWRQAYTGPDAVVLVAPAVRQGRVIPAGEAGLWRATQGQPGM